FPPADFFHHLLFSSRTFGFAFRRERFGPFSRSPWSFTPPPPVKASNIWSWFFCRLSLIESCVLLAAPGCLGLRPRGLLCPLLTPAPRSGWIAPPSVTMP